MCVQEAPKFFRWRARGAQLARECGLLYVTGGGTTGGTTLLAHLRVDVERTAELALSRYRLGWPDRGVAAAVVRKSGARLAVASLHLPLPETQRLGPPPRAPAGPPRCGARAVPPTRPPPVPSTSGRTTRPGPSSRTKGCATWHRAAG